MNSISDDRKRMELLEAALIDYVERYGLPERAKVALTPLTDEQEFGLIALVRGFSRRRWSCRCRSSAKAT